MRLRRWQYICQLYILICVFCFIKVLEQIVTVALSDTVPSGLCSTSTVDGGLCSSFSASHGPKMLIKHGTGGQAKP